MYVMAYASDSYCVQVRGVSGELEESHPRHGTDRVLQSNFQFSQYLQGCDSDTGCESH